METRFSTPVRRLDLQAVVAASLTLFLLAASAGAFFVIRSAERDRLTMTALQGAHALHGAIRAARPAGPEAVHEILRTFEFEGIVYFAIVAPDGTLAAHAGDPPPVLPALEPTILTGLASDDFRAEFIETPSGREVFDVLMRMPPRIGGPGRHSMRLGPSMPADGPPFLGEGMLRVGVDPAASAWMWNWVWAQAATSAAVALALWIAWHRGRRVSRALAALEGEQRRREELARLGEMSAVLAHEIRNPVAAMKGHLQLAAEAIRDAAAPPGVSGRLETALAEVARIESLVRGLLEYARDRPIVRSEIPLSELVERGIVLGCAEKSLPAMERVCRDPGTVRVDVEAMVRAIANLVSNAVEAAGPKGRVRVSASLKETRAEIIVEDSGPGVDPELADRLFDPFVTGKVRGVGLGLSVARKVTEAHGGTVSAGHSPDLGGAAFRLEFSCEG